LGDLYAREKEYVAAVASYRLAIQQKADYPEAYMNLARVFVTTEQFPEAEETFQHALSLSPDDPEILYHMGQFYRITDNMEKARECFSKSLEHSQGNERLQELAREALDSL
ncbi:MAG: tetratricopeptide repeat protein, partial [bacterium]